MIHLYHRWSWVAAIAITIATGLALGHYVAMAYLGACAGVVFIAFRPLRREKKCLRRAGTPPRAVAAAAARAGIRETHRLDVRKVFWCGAAIVALCAAACEEFDEPAPPVCLDGECPLSQALPLPLPTVDLPEETRCWNWGGGSCYHASIINVMRAQGLWELSDWWRQSFIGAESTSRLSAKLDQAGVQFAVCTSGDEEFLDWCNRTRRWAAITFKPNHAISFVGWDSHTAWLLDNNHPDRYESLPRRGFVELWRRQYGGQAVTTVYGPLPPRMASIDVSGL